LPSNIFIQFLAGPPKVRGGAFGGLLRAIAWVTLAIAPVLLLLFIQIQFLPYHSVPVVWTQRVALGVDLVLIWWLWRKILSGREVDGGRGLGTWLWPPLGVALSLAVLLFSVTVVTFPGEWQEARLPSWPILPAMAEWGRPATENDTKGNQRTASIRDWLENAKRVSLHDWLFNAEPDFITRRRLPFSSTLVLPDVNVYEGLGIDDPDKAKWHDYVFHARGRDLKGAIFDFATLPKVDFDAADLRDASLDGAQLQGALLNRAQLQGASLWGAGLQGASLNNAQLQGAQLSTALFQGAQLIFAQLQGASFGTAQLQGARLSRPELGGAELSYTRLQGAWVDGAYLQGASLRSAQLQGASLERSTLDATDLSDAYLWRTNRSELPSTVAALRMSGESWAPEWWDEEGKRQPWDDKAYQALRTTIASFPRGSFVTRR
jgi:Pentapeptide repeats (8 copies)